MELKKKNRRFDLTFQSKIPMITSLTLFFLEISFRFF